MTDPARAARVDLTHAQHDASSATGLCFAAVSPGGERTFFSYRGANVALAMPNIDAAFLDVTWLHVGGHALLEGVPGAGDFRLLEDAHRDLGDDAEQSFRAGGDAQ